MDVSVFVLELVGVAVSVAVAEGVAVSVDVPDVVEENEVDGVLVGVGEGEGGLATALPIKEADVTCPEPPVSQVQAVAQNHPQPQRPQENKLWARYV